MPISLDPVCPCHLRILTAPPAHSCEARNLSWQCFSGVIAISWNPCLFTRFTFTSPSLSFGVSFSYIRPSSLDSLFSPYPILLTWLSLFSFEIFYLDVSFVLRRFCILVSFSWHLFLLTFWYLATKIHPAYYKTCTKPFLYHKTTKWVQYYFVLRSLHKVLPSTTSDHKGCTK